MIHFVSPSVRPMAWARPLANPGKLGDLDSAFLSAWPRVSVKPGPAIFRIGEDDGGNRLGLESHGLAEDDFNGGLALVRRFGVPASARPPRRRWQEYADMAVRRCQMRP